MMLHNKRSGQLIIERDVKSKRELVMLAIAEGRPLAGADLQGVNFSNMELFNVNFILSYCQGASFENCTLDDADFTEANLMGAIFDDATLYRVDMRRANLTGASFDGAVIHDVHLHHAVGL